MCGWTWLCVNPVGTHRGKVDEKTIRRKCRKKSRLRVDPQTGERPDKCPWLYCCPGVLNEKESEAEADRIAQEIQGGQSLVAITQSGSNGNGKSNGHKKAVRNPNRRGNHKGVRSGRNGNVSNKGYIRRGKDRGKKAGRLRHYA